MVIWHIQQIFEGNIRFEVDFEFYIEQKPHSSIRFLVFPKVKKKIGMGAWKCVWLLKNK